MRRFLVAVFLVSFAHAPHLAAQADNPEVQRFKILAARIVDQRLNGLPEDEKQQQQALDLLDGFVARRISASSAIDAKSLNQSLTQFVAQHPSVGESYQVVPVGASLPVYALVVNFSSSGPAAIRLYALPGIAADKSQQVNGGQPRRVGQIDRFAVADFFDENVDVIFLISGAARAASTSPADAGSEAVFLTVSGRTDDLQTGAFAVWRWSDAGLRRVWESELLQQSAYEAAGDELRLTFCGETDDDRPRVCRRMVRETYAWREGTWKRLEQSDLPITKP